ncbi:Chaperonin ClpA/B [Corchorus olitorius]|uniref:Chaperonin ClpA/B n=1 Tax=Corchorus olitorius TaxID=93759 RepID=A0A1R3K5Z2_9ROSI|nr:Chaperonin ClpA/B [Corchorus olitorius]
MLKISQLISTQVSRGFSDLAKEVKGLIDYLYGYDDALSSSDEPGCKVEPSCLSEEATVDKGRLNKRVKKGLDNLLILSKPKDLSFCRPKSYLLLGLHCHGKAHLADYLDKNLVTGDGVTLVVDIDLSNFSDDTALLRLKNELVRSIGNEQRSGSSQIVGNMKLRPYNIILFNQVEKAHISVFSTLLLALDVGMCKDSHGNIIDFSDTIIILTSELGNKKIITRLFEAREHQEPDSLHEFRALHRKEKQKVQNFYLLMLKISQLISTQVSRGFSGLAKEVKGLIDNLDDYDDALSSSDEPGCKVEPSCLPEEATVDKGRLNKRVKKGLDNLLILSKPENLSFCRPKSYLLLGLHCHGKAHLADYLGKNLVTGDGVTLVVDIDLSDFSDDIALLRLKNELARSIGNEQRSGSSQIVGNMKLRPYNIILFNQVEKAHISVFSALLSALDVGMCRDSHGNIIDFSDTIIILTSEGFSDLAKEVKGLIDNLDDYDDALSSSDEPGCKVEPSCLPEEATVDKGRLNKRVKKGLDNLLILSKPENLSFCRPKTYLLLGLHCHGKAHLANYLGKNLVTGDGVTLVVDIDLSDFSDDTALLRLKNELASGLVLHKLLAT